MTATHRQLLVVLVAAAIALVSPSAFAWVETHVVSDDVRIDVERSGAATVDHAITIRVQGGPLRAFDLVGADRDAAPLGDGTAISGQADGLLGIPVPLNVTPRPDGALRVNIEHPKGLSRGVFLFHVRYRTNLLTSGAVERDGAMLRVRWTGAVWPDGIDAAKATFVLPPAPTEPRAAGDRLAAEGEAEGDPQTSEAGAFISQVKRGTDRDEIELTRPHVARSEPVVWTIRVDPRALGEVRDPRLAPLPAAAEAEQVPTEQRALYAAGAGFILVLFSALVAVKARQVAVHAAAKGVRPRPLLPIGTPLRTLLAGPVLAGSIALQVTLDDPRIGTVGVLVAMALTTYLTPAWRAAPRGPGRWLPVGDWEAFAGPKPVKGAWLDASTRAGKACLVGALAIVAAIAFAASRVSSYYAYLVLFDATVLAALFGTGRLRELPPDPATASAKALAKIAKRLRRHKWVRAVAIGRLPQGAEGFDEVRLLVAPRLPLRGFTSLEVGYAYSRGAGGFFAMPEILVRVVDGTDAHEVFSKLLGARWLRGRKPDERVAVVSPKLPMLAMTLSLATKLCERARDAAKAGEKPASRRQPSSKAAISAGRSERTSNAGTLASPVHST